MARKPRICPAGYAQHVVQRGNNSSVCFAAEEDYVACAHSLNEGADKYGIIITRLRYGRDVWIFTAGRWRPAKSRRKLLANVTA